MKKMSKISLISLSVLSGIFGCFAYLNNTNKTSDMLKADSETTYTVVNADVSKFKKVLPNANCKTFEVDTTNQTITTDGSWDSSFATTNQFDTLTTSYYLKAHVYNADSPGDYADGIAGFNIYFDNENTFNFYVKWMSASCTGSIAEACFLSHVNNKTRKAYQSAQLPNGSFITRSTDFTDVWTDFGGWTTGNDRNSGTGLNMRTEGSTILLNKGFDLTLYVDRTTYKNRLVDVMQIQVDAFAGDGVTPQTFFTPKYAVDAFTAPIGVESKFAYIKPQIGFWTYNVGKVTYSNIQFGSNRVSKVVTASFNSVGATPSKAIINNSSSSLTYNNTNFNSGFFMAENLEVTSPRNDFQAHVSSSIGDVADSAIGYVFYYDEQNYVTMYLRWDGSAGTIAGFHVLATVNGQDSNVYQGARNPWDDSNVTSGAQGYTTVSGIKDMWSDDGFVTDAEYPCGVDNNFNIFRSNSAITLSAGFDMGVIRRRTTFLSRTVDEYQMFIIANNTSGIKQIWYTPLWCMDAYTYPNGGSEASSLINATPSIGFYSFQCGDVTISDIKLNGDTIKPKDIRTLEFGSRVEGELTLYGSDLGSNWSVNENNLTESWEELEANSHYREVNALKANENQNSYISAELSASRLFGASSYVGIYPYYLDTNNFLLAYIQSSNGSVRFVVTGKLNGENLGGMEWLLDTALNNDIKNSTLVEIGIVDNTVNFYIGQTPKPTYSYDFTKQSFKDRALLGAQSGFSVYNANANINNFVISASERINPYTPSEEDKPTIYEYGNKETSGFVGYAFKIPTFVAFNYLNEAIDTVITISKEDGTLVETLEKGVFEFTVNETGTYVVSVNATDEWGHSAKEISYKVNFTSYIGPGESAPKQVLWQTVVVLCFFGLVLLITAGCGVVLLKKNKKEALRAAELNRKNHEKNLIDDEEEE